MIKGNRKQVQNNVTLYITLHFLGLMAEVEVIIRLCCCRLL